MSFSHRWAEGQPRRLLTILLCSLLLLGGLLPPPAAAVPPDRGLDSVAGGAADDVLGQTMAGDFAQPDFTDGAENDGPTLETLGGPCAVAVDTRTTASSWPTTGTTGCWSSTSLPATP